MKQRISVQQLIKLSPEQSLKLTEWYTPTTGDFIWDNNYQSTGLIHDVECYTERCSVIHVVWPDETQSDFQQSESTIPLLSIGQMIAFIQEKKPQLKGISKNRFDKWFVNLETGQLGYKDELCDALWETVRQLLK